MSPSALISHNQFPTKVTIDSPLKLVSLNLVLYSNLQNSLAATRTDLGGKACSVTGPALKPRTALGEIGNIAVNKEPQKKVKFFDAFFYPSFTFRRKL